MPFRIVKLTLLSLLVSSLAFAMCTGCADDKQSDKKAGQSDEKTGHEGMRGAMEHPQDESSGSEAMKMGGTMDALFTAEGLYTCPMHPEVVTADAEATCPLCKMKMMALSEEKTSELRASKPLGCPMDAIVVKGGSDTENCPVCKMKLSLIKQTEVHEHG